MSCQSSVKLASASGSLSSPKPLSEKKLTANRANAQHSTGPRTPEGKKRAAQNASTHRLFCGDLLHHHEPDKLFHILRNTLLHDLCPQSVLELSLAERIVSLHWRLRRVQAADNHLVTMEQADHQEDLQDHNRRVQKLQQERPDLLAQDPLVKIIPIPKNLSPAYYLARSLHAPIDNPDQKHKTSPFERILIAEQRLQNMLHKAHKELRQLQADRNAKLQDPTFTPAHCPYITYDDPSDNNDEQQPQASTPQPPDPAQQGATKRNIPTPIPQNEPTEPPQDSALSAQDLTTSTIQNSEFNIPSPISTPERKE